MTIRVGVAPEMELGTGLEGRSGEAVAGYQPLAISQRPGSNSDMQTTTRLGYPFIVVSVDAETWCWWTRDQVKRFVRQGSTLGRPIAGQVSWLESGPRITRNSF